MLSSFLTYRGGARYHAAPSGSGTAERRGGDAVITVHAGEKKPHISRLRALSFMLTGHIRRVEQGSVASASAGGHFQRVAEGRAASEAPLAERGGPTERAAVRPWSPQGKRSADAPALPDRRMADGVRRRPRLIRQADADAVPKGPTPASASVCSAKSGDIAGRGTANVLLAKVASVAGRSASLPTQGTFCGDRAATASAGGTVLAARAISLPAHGDALSGRPMPSSSNAAFLTRPVRFSPAVSGGISPPADALGHPQEAFATTLNWMFPRAGSVASPAPARRVNAGDVPPPLPPKQRNRAGVTARPGRATPSAAARDSGAARFSDVMAWLSREGHRGAAYRLPPEQQHAAVVTMMGQVFHELDGRQASELYDALLGLIDRWPRHLQAGILRELSVQAFHALPEQRLAEHCQRWLNRLPGFEPATCDDLLEHIATYFAAVPADDGLVVFQRVVALSRASERPILSLLARRLGTLTPELRGLAWQILLGCPHLPAEMRTELSAALRAAEEAQGGAAASDVNAATRAA